MINNDEIELFLSQLNATLKDYYGNNSDYVNVPNDICNLVREGIKISLIQSPVTDTDFSFFVVELITDKYSKFRLSEEQISKVKLIVSSSEFLSKVRNLAIEKGDESARVAFPSISLNITRRRLSLRENNDELNNSNKKR